MRLLILLLLASCNTEIKTVQEKVQQARNELETIPTPEIIARFNYNLAKYNDGTNTCYMYGESVSCVKNGSGVLKFIKE